MSALPQPDYKDVASSINFSASKNKTRERTNFVSNSSINSDKKYSSKTTRISRKKRSSALQLLIILQKGSFGLAAISLMSCLAVYRATVAIPQLWSQEYETLEALQRQERQLVALDEALKYELAKGAEQPELEMSAISHESTVFIEPTSIKPQETVENKPQLWQSTHMGY